MSMCEEPFVSPASPRSNVYSLPLVLVRVYGDLDQPLHFYTWSHNISFALHVANAMATAALTVLR